MCNTDLENHLVLELQPLPQPGPLEPDPEPAAEPMCVVCEAAPPAKLEDDGRCVDCAVQFYTQHPAEFDDTPEWYFDQSADLQQVRDRVCLERVRARGLLIERPIAMAPTPTPAHLRAAEIVAREATRVAQGGDAEAAEILLRLAVRARNAA